MIKQSRCPENASTPKKVNPKVSHHWFNAECRQTQRQYRRLKNLRRRVNNVEHFCASKAYKKCINKQYKTKYVNKLRNLRNSDPKAYWKLLNKFDGSRTATAQKLSLEPFAEHFKKLNTTSSDNNTLPQFDLTNVSDHNLEINSPITEQEVLKSINCLKLNKKVQVGKDQEKAQSERDSHSKNRGGKKPN